MSTALVVVVASSRRSAGLSRDEIHVLVLPSQAAFDAYRRGPRERRAGHVLWSGADVSLETIAG